MKDRVGFKFLDSKKENLNRNIIPIKKIMKQNWLMKKASLANTNHDYIIFKNPSVKKKLQSILSENIHPQLNHYLDKCGYPYNMEIEKETELSVENRLVLSLWVFLYDEFGIFYRGKLSLSLKHWIWENDFFLELPEDNDPALVFRLISDERIKSSPPELSIEKSFDNHYHIKFHSGFGEEPILDDRLMEKVEQSININIKMKKTLEDGYPSEEEVQKFLNLAVIIYE